MLIQLYPSNKLLQKSSNIEEFNDKLEQIVKDMTVLMRKLKGAGLAAPQVGILKNLFIIEKNSEAVVDNILDTIDVFVNPKILNSSDDSISISEGCLSFPGIFENVNRPKKIDVKYNDLKGNIVYETLDDFKSRVFQHEYEHLQGEVFIKHLSALKRDIVKRKMNKINSILGTR